MRYTPYTEAEIQSMHVLAEGTYAFQVLEVITTNYNGTPMIDKNGNDLAKLKLLVWDNEQKERHIYTYISGDGAFAYKLRHFACSLGLVSDYEQGVFNIHNTIGKSGSAHVIIKKGTMKTDGSGELWPDRNDVKDFIVDTKLNKSSSVATTDPELNDDLPF